MCRVHFISAIVVMMAFVGCSGESEPDKALPTETVKSEGSEVEPKKEPKEKPMPVEVPNAKIAGELLVPTMPNSVKDVMSKCAAAITDATAIRDKIVAVEGERTLENTLVWMNEIAIKIDSVLPLAELMANVHTDKKIRTAEEKCQQNVMKFISELGLDQEVFKALAALKVESLDPMAKRSLEHLLRDYKRSGVDKDAATRKKLASLLEEMVKVGQEFSRRIREDKKFIEVMPDDLAGMPQDFIDGHPAGENGKIKITTDYPDFFPIQNYAEKEDVRKSLYLAFLSRAYPENEAAMKKLLELRHEYATLLGYPNWAQYNAEDKMANNQHTIAAFLDKIAVIARSRMEKDLSEVLERKKKDSPDAEMTHVWDRFYYVKKIQEERFGVNSQEVRKYFDYEKVRDGILAVNQDLFGVEFKKVEDAVKWHEDVAVYDVLEDGKQLGRFMLDMHPREGKYGHAAMFNVAAGISGVQLPIAALICNFPKPGEAGPALMEHGDVTTFFHEFGHLMHHLLGSGYKWANLSGIACEWDFVEAPSQLLEEWAWDAKVIGQFAKHHETGEVISADLVKKMRDAEGFGKGMHVMRQLFYAGLSFNYHVKDPKELNMLETLKEVQKKYSPYPYEEGTYTYCNFGHLEGYSSMYYTYMWSLNLAKDLFTRFNTEGIMNKKTAADYRKYVIGAGGAVDAADIVKNFLGRESSFDAFETYLKK